MDTQDVENEPLVENEVVQQEPQVELSEQATPEELGVGKVQANEPFSPIDWDSNIDKIQNDIVAKKQKDEIAAENAKEEAGIKDDEPETKPAEESKEKIKDEQPKEAKVEPVKEEVKEPTKAEEIAEIAELEKKIDPHSSPKTKKLFNEVKGIAAKERAEREKIANELKAAREELEKTKTNAVPKELQDELQQLRDKIRQFDANADPAIINKYDNVITSNNDSIIKTLTDAGLPQEHAERLKKSGVTLANLKPYLDTLETGKGADGKQYDADPDTAEAIRERLRENMRLGKDKEREITDWRNNYEQRTKAQEEQQKASVTEAEKRLANEFQTHVSKWDFLKKPADVLDTDAPAIRKQKETAIKEFNEVALKYGETIKKETATALDAQIAARTGILYRDHIAPKLANQLQNANKEIETLRAQINNMKKAGSVSKTIGTSKPAAAPKKEINMGDGFEDLIDAAAAEAFNNKG